MIIKVITFSIEFLKLFIYLTGPLNVMALIQTSRNNGNIDLICFLIEEKAQHLE